MIQTNTFIGIVIMIAGGFLLPAGVCIWWFVSKKEKFTTALTGAGVWFVFALILEQIPISSVWSTTLSDQ